MPTKPPIANPNSAAAKKAKRLEKSEKQHTRNQKKKGPECKFAKVPPATCLSCGQTTHDIDRDSAPEDPHFLNWAKTFVDSRGRKIPYGPECTGCFSCRRKFFPKYTQARV